MKGMAENDIMSVRLYRYGDDETISLEDEIKLCVKRFMETYGVPLSQIKIFLRKEEMIPAYDFGDLNVITISKGLQPHHFQIGPVPRRDPIIFTGERKPYE